MAEQTNIILIEGNLTIDPESRQAGKDKVTRFRVASNRSWKDDKGEKQTRVTFIDVEAWKNFGEMVAKHLKKGRHVLVQGRLDHNQWTDEEGHPHSRLFISADNVRFLDAPEKAEKSDKTERAEKAEVAEPLAVSAF